MSKALWQVVQFLWREHVKQDGDDTDKPSKADVWAAMADAQVEYKAGKCKMYNFDEVDIPTLANMKAEAMPAMPSSSEPAAASSKRAKTRTKEAAAKAAPKKSGELMIAREPKMQPKRKKKDESDESSVSFKEEPIDFDKIKAKMNKKKLRK